MSKREVLTRTATDWTIYALVCDWPLAGTILVDNEFVWISGNNNGQASYGKSFSKYNNLCEFISIKI